MARIVPKLNLNRTPETVDNHSLIFAKNVRFNGNGLSSDFGFERIDEWTEGTPPLINVHNVLTGDEKIVGVIPYNTSFYIFVYGSRTVTSETEEDSVVYYSKIIKYDEETGWENCRCNWNWSGGKIDGICTINLNGDILLTVAEYDVPDGKLVPIKTINLTESTVKDDESIYTQTPKVPFINLKCNSTYKNTIPAGVYQFFIRYEIRKDFYTDWFPASKELFAGCRKKLRTNQGGVMFIDTTIDSDTSFILTVEKVIDVSSFKNFQLGFIISHDDDVYARSYKHYSMSTSTINFDYDTEYIEELDVRDLLQSPYGLYNVGNVTSFKNKLYISNYKELNVNPDIEYFAQSIDIDFEAKYNTNVALFAGRTIIYDGSNTNYISGVKLNEVEGGNNITITSIVDKLVKDTQVWIEHSLEEGLSDSTSLSYCGVNLNMYKTIYRLRLQDDTHTPTEPGEDGRWYPSELYDDVPTQDVDTPPALNEQVYKLTQGSTEIGSYDTLEEAIAVIKDYINVIQVNTADIGKFDDEQFTINNHFQITYYTSTTANHVTNWYRHYVSFNFSVNKNDILVNYTNDNQYSLIPYQKYNFYIHLIKDNGETTNGYLIPSGSVEIPEFGTSQDNLPAIYPTFTFHSNLPTGYVACFISIMHVGNKVAQVFNITQEPYTWASSSDKYTMGSCLELDAELYPWLTNIPFVRTVEGNRIEHILDYRASADTDFLLTFGGAGECVFQDDTTDLNLTDVVDGTSDLNFDNDVTYGFIVMPYMANPEYIQSVRCTPFITYSIASGDYCYDDYDSLNIPGYLCRVKKPLRHDNLITYLSGTDFYKKQVHKDTSDAFQIHVEPYTSADNFYDRVILKDSNEYYIYSNFNLNYISLVEAYVPRITSKSIETTNNGVTSKTNEYYTIVAKDSSILSGIYKLPSMYYNYTRKMYYPYTTRNVLTTFDNTIRSSILEGDEAKVNIFKFNTVDYYNVPTDKGKIVNLVAVGDNILVHTQDSIYKFSGQNSLTAAGGEDVQMKESEVFDTGIQELFGSEYGYAGLASKDHQILSEFGYTFWDKDSGRIYLYTGNAQMKVLSDDIAKLLRYDTITNIYLADDYYNNRIFVSIQFSNGKSATLSYDFVVKSFISLHDFKFDWSFKTKTKCYFVRKNIDYTEIYRIDSKIGSYLSLKFTDSLYPIHNEEDCIVDVIFNDSFEVIKTLNAISWICNRITGFTGQLNMAEETFTNEPIEKRYKGNILRLYTDSCATDEINIEGRANDANLSISDSYQQVRYNLGKWTFNYFRNVLNRTNSPINNRLFEQDDTLIYGKYIVARFIFSRTIDFKFEDITFYTSNENNI